MKVVHPPSPAHPRVGGFEPPADESEPFCAVSAPSPTDPLSQRARWAGGEGVVNVLMARALAYPGLISLAAGFVDPETLPVDVVRAVMEAIGSDPARARAALQYGTTLGHRPLREAIVARLDAAETAAGQRLSADHVVVTAGSNQILYLATDVLVNPGDIVLCGAPSYYVYLGTLANLGARAVGVAVDEQGIIPEAVEEALRLRARSGELHQVKALYVTTYFDNPTGITLPAERRAALMEIAQRWSRRQKLYIIEDAAYRELRYAGDDVPSLRSFDTEGDTVIHAGTFSKSFSPGIRVGWGILPPALLGPVLAEKGNIDFGSPHFSQVLVATMIELGLFDAHLARLRAAYGAKLAAMLSAAEEHLRPIAGVDWVAPRGGLYLWVRLPEGMASGLESRLFARALQEGVLYVPGETCFPDGGDARRTSAVRLSFGVPSCEGIRRGVAALARAIGAATP